MYKKKIIMAFVVALILSVGASNALAAVRTVTLRVKGVTCGGCATSVEKALTATGGVAAVRVSYERGTAVVRYDDKKVTVAKLREVINGTGMTCEVPH